MDRAIYFIEKLTRATLSIHPISWAGLLTITVVLFLCIRAILVRVNPGSERLVRHSILLTLFLGIPLVFILTCLTFYFVLKDQP